MKVVILAGGRGTRLAEETGMKPKPMVEIGGRPILWHILQHYAYHGFSEFVVALGYKGWVIKHYFLDYYALSNGLTVNLGSGEIEFHRERMENWIVHLKDTGLNTMTGGRVKRLESLLKDDTFMVTYGDGVSDVDLSKLLQFHRSHGKIATVTAVRPPARFGGLLFDGDMVERFTEKPQIGEGWINGGFLVFEPGIFDYLQGDDDSLEAHGLEQLARDGQIAAYRHEGFWQCMDTLRDKQLLEDLWERGEAPWMVFAGGGMRVLVTGSSGYIGTVMVPILQSAGHEIVGLDANYFKDCIMGRWPNEVPTLDKDLREVKAEDLSGLDAVIHLGGLSNDPMGDLSPELTFEINYIASVHLAKMTKKAGIERFLFSSSCSLYGTGGKDELLTEEAPFNPLTPYAKSKVLTERDVSALADDHFSPTFLRNATAYGFSPRLRADIVLNNLVGWAHTTGKVKILSDGTPWRPLVHVEDIAYAFLAALEAPQDLVHNQAFNVGCNRENYQVKDLAEIVARTVPDCEIEYAGKNNPDPRDYRVDFSKIERILPDYKPRWTAEKGALQLFEAYQSCGLTLEEFKGFKYIRLHQLKRLLEEGLLDSSLYWVKRQGIYDHTTAEAGGIV